MSTAAGIGDYRGNDGKWTEMDRADRAVADAERDAKRRRASDAGTSPPVVIDLTSDDDGDQNDDAEQDEGVPYEALRPTLTHEALKLLHERGFLSICISQNCDGLHALSGLPADALLSLHGDVFTERCENAKCGKRFVRDFYTPDDLAGEWYELKAAGEKPAFARPKHAKECERCGLNHRTGRRCDSCGAHLLDTIINFGDCLEEDILDRATAEANKADLFLSLGTLMTVPPACDLIKKRTRAELVICNRQRTTLDARAKRHGERVFGDCDQLMRRVVALLIGESEARKWEAGRSKRAKKWDAQRAAV